MKKINIIPLADRVIVKQDAAETTTASGIIIPDTAQEKPQEGKVIAVGGGAKTEEGVLPVDKCLPFAAAPTSVSAVRRFR